MSCAKPRMVRESMRILNRKQEYSLASEGSAGGSVHGVLLLVTSARAFSSPTRRRRRSRMGSRFRVECLNPGPKPYTLNSSNPKP